MQGSTWKIPLIIIGSLILTVASPFFGLSTISPSALLEPDNLYGKIFWIERVPRVVAAFLAGAGLAMSGMVFQALFRNPLATPFTLGVSSGASFGASIYFWVGASFLGALGGLSSAMLGAALSMLLVYLVTRAKGGFSTSVMLLAGVIISFFFSSMVMLVQYLSNQTDSLLIMRWLMGSLTGLEIPRLADLAFIIAVGTVTIWLMAPEIDLLTAGEELAASRGVKVNQAKIKIFVVASVMVAAVVSLAGPIGFVGMMVPHICRMWLGWSHRLLLPAVFFSGGCFLVMCDMAARMILAPAELPIGIVTALLGGPFFLWTLFKTTQSGDIF